jgi:hypothetical protein
MYYILGGIIEIVFRAITLMVINCLARNFFNAACQDTQRDQAANADLNVLSTRRIMFFKNLTIPCGFFTQINMYVATFCTITVKNHMSSSE